MQKRSAQDEEAKLLLCCCYLPNTTTSSPTSADLETKHDMTRGLEALMLKQGLLWT